MMRKVNFVTGSPPDEPLRQPMKTNPPEGAVPAKPRPATAKPVSPPMQALVLNGDHQNDYQSEQNNQTIVNPSRAPPPPKPVKPQNTRRASLTEIDGSSFNGIRAQVQAALPTVVPKPVPIPKPAVPPSQPNGPARAHNQITR